MAKSCKGLAMELVKCLSESDCVKVQNRPFRECAKEKSPLISSECVGLRETYFNCKRGQEPANLKHYFGILAVNGNVWRNRNVRDDFGEIETLRTILAVTYKHHDDVCSLLICM